MPRHARKIHSITRELWDAQARGESFDRRHALAMRFSKTALASELTSGDPNADREGAMRADKSELAEYVVEKAEESAPIALEVSSLLGWFK